MGGISPRDGRPEWENGYGRLMGGADSETEVEEDQEKVDTDV